MRDLASLSSSSSSALVLSIAAWEKSSIGSLRARSARDIAKPETSRSAAAAAAVGTGVLVR
eukprot:4507886-Prymnesium_polylepis.1